MAPSDGQPQIPLYVYAIIPSAGRNGELTGLGDGIHVVEAGAFAAVVGPATETSFLGRGKQDLARLLLAHQRVVERVMACTPVLPVRFATVAPDRAGIERCLKTGSTDFAAAFETLQGKTQFEIQVTWALEAVFAEIAQEPEVLELKAAATAGEPARDASARLGARVKASLERRRSDLGEALAGALRAATVDVVTNPPVDDRMVLNATVLIDSQREDALDRCLEGLDAAHGGRLTFRCVGPLPPHGFATVEVAFLDAGQIDRARRILQLDPAYDIDAVRTAYRRLAKQAHPDLAGCPETGEEIGVLSDAYKTLRSYVEAGGPVIVSVRRPDPAPAEPL